MNLQRVREEAIDTILSNLIMANALLQNEVTSMMSRLVRMDNTELAKELVASRYLLNAYLGSRSRN